MPIVVGRPHVGARPAFRGRMREILTPVIVTYILSAFFANNVVSVYRLAALSQLRASSLAFGQ